MEIRGERKNKKVRFASLKEGEAFYYNSELLMKMSEVCDNSDDYGGIAYNCVLLRNGRIIFCADEAMVGIARVHIEKEY